jgi:hypothetical protein
MFHTEIVYLDEISVFRRVIIIGFEVIAAVVMVSFIFWDITPVMSVGSKLTFRRTVTSIRE